MDFITHLPKIQNKSVILVVVDQLTKYAHFGALPSGFNVVMVADLFIDMIVKLHGVPKSIVSDRDSIFTSKFWREIHQRNGTALNMTSAYHPQSNGQTEVTNKGLEHYLRSFCHTDPKGWLKLLPWCELWYNTNYHGPLGMTPFKALYGRDPQGLMHYEQGSSQVQAVDDLLTLREETLERLKNNLDKAQRRMKLQAAEKEQMWNSQWGNGF